MSGPKHTPGPWRAVQRTGRVHRAADEWLVTAPGVEEVVCRIERWTPEQDEADARLIAASPRLADELRDIAKHLETYDPQGDVQAWLRSLLDYHLPQARAALREAGVES